MSAQGLCARLAPQLGPSAWTAPTRKSLASRSVRASWVALVLICATLWLSSAALTSVDRGPSRALRKRAVAHAPFYHGVVKSLSRAQGDLDGVLAGGWADVDLAPVNALSKALTRFLNVTDSATVEGHSGNLVVERKVYYALASMPSVHTICEIGFNGGHSAALWLHANPSAQVYMFDLWAHEYSPRGEAFLRSPAAAALGIQDADARLHIIKGPSQVTVPTFAVEHPGVQCDLLSVDGGHSYDLAVADITNMAQLARPQFNVLVVDDTNCAASWCVDAALEEQQRRGLVRRLGGFAEKLSESGGFMRGVTVAQYLK